MIRLNKDFNILVGRRIRQTRALLSLSREKFSEKCGISTSFLADIELGNKGLSVETLHRICISANISPAYVILGKDTSNDANAITELLNQLEPKYINSAVDVLKAFIAAINQK